MTTPARETKRETVSDKHRVSYLTVSQQYALDHACRLIEPAFGGFGCYHVGSSLSRPDWRDVDLRCILSDEEYDAFIGPRDVRLKFLNVCISDWLAARTGLPIDFQFQRFTEANKEFPSPTNQRNAVAFPLKYLEERDRAALAESSQ